MLTDKNYVCVSFSSGNIIREIFSQLENAAIFKLLSKNKQCIVKKNISHRNAEKL